MSLCNVRSKRDILARVYECWLLLLILVCIYLTVMESFDDYIAKETLDGDNKYDAGDHGFQVCNTFGTSSVYFERTQIQSDRHIN